LTSILDRLVSSRGLITRDVGESDRRTFVITLTAKGRSQARRVSHHLSDLERAVVRRVSAADIKGFNNLVTALEHKKFTPIVSISILALAIAKAQDPAKAQRCSTITQLLSGNFRGLSYRLVVRHRPLSRPRTRSADSIGVAVRLERKSTSDVV
jgi:hypothetical protein